MTKSLLRAVCVALSVLPLSLVDGSAQEFPESCTYEVCALRISYPGWFSSPKVVQGVDGAEVFKVGRSDEARELFATIDSAAVHYARFESADRRSSVFGWVGLTLLVAGGVVGATTDTPNGQARKWFMGLTIGGSALTLASIRPFRRSRTEFSEAVWWYNHALPRSEVTEEGW